MLQSLGRDKLLGERGGYKQKPDGRGESQTKSEGEESDVRRELAVETFMKLVSYLGQINAAVKVSENQEDKLSNTGESPAELLTKSPQNMSLIDKIKYVLGRFHLKGGESRDVVLIGMLSEVFVALVLKSLGYTVEFSDTEGDKGGVDMYITVGNLKLPIDVKAHMGNSFDRDGVWVLFVGISQVLTKLLAGAGEYHILSNNLTRAAEDVSRDIGSYFSHDNSGAKSYPVYSPV